MQVLKYANWPSDDVIHSTKVWSNLMKKDISANLYQKRLILCSKILLNVSQYKLSSSFQTPSGSLQDWFEALTKDSPGSHSLWWIFKTSVFPENLEKECCESFKFWTTLWKLLTNITFMFYVPSGKGVIDSGQGPLQAVLGGQLFLQRTWACRSWPNSWFNEMGLEISLRRIIINT